MGLDRTQAQQSVVNCLKIIYIFIDHAAVGPLSRYSGWPLIVRADYLIGNIKHYLWFSRTNSGSRLVLCTARSIIWYFCASTSNFWYLLLWDREPGHCHINESTSSYSYLIVTLIRSCCHKYLNRKCSLINKKPADMSWRIEVDTKLLNTTAACSMHIQDFKN